MSDFTIDTTKLTVRGQLVIPKSIREKMNLKEGDRFIVISATDSIILKKIDSESNSINHKDIVSKTKNLLDKFKLRM